MLITKLRHRRKHAHTLCYGRSAYDLHGVRARDPNIGIFSPSFKVHTLRVCFRVRVFVRVYVCVTRGLRGTKYNPYCATIRRRSLEYKKQDNYKLQTNKKQSFDTVLFYLLRAPDTAMCTYINRCNNNNVLYYSSSNVRFE